MTKKKGGKTKRKETKRERQKRQKEEEQARLEEGPVPGMAVLTIAFNRVGGSFIHAASGWESPLELEAVLDAFMKQQVRPAAIREEAVRLMAAQGPIPKPEEAESEQKNESRTSRRDTEQRRPPKAD